jgi:hypothetical protein
VHSQWLICARLLTPRSHFRPPQSCPRPPVPRPPSPVPPLPLSGVSIAAGYSVGCLLSVLITECKSKKSDAAPAGTIGALGNEASIPGWLLAFACAVEFCLIYFRFREPIDSDLETPPAAVANPVVATSANGGSRMNAEQRSIHIAAPQFVSDFSTVLTATPGPTQATGSKGGASKGNKASVREREDSADSSHLSVHSRSSRKRTTSSLSYDPEMAGVIISAQIDDEIQQEEGAVVEAEAGAASLSISGPLYIVFLMCFLIPMNISGWEVLLAVQAEEHWGWTPSDTGLYLFLILTLAIPVYAMNLGAIMSDRSGVLCFVLAGLLGTLMFLGHQHKPLSLGVAIFTIGSVVFLLSMQIARGFAWALLTSLAIPSQRPVIVGINAVLFMLGRGAGAIMAPLLTVEAYALVFAGSTSLAWLAMCWAYFAAYLPKHISGPKRKGDA